MDRQLGHDRLAIIAGGGQLPHHVAAAARAAGDSPFVILLEGEATGDWTDFPHERLGIGNFARLKSIFTQRSIGRVVLSGSVRARPVLSQIRPALSTILKLPSVLANLLSGGDDSVLTMVIDLIEAEGVKVIGVQDVVPGLIAKTGPVGTIGPTREALRDIDVAAKAARLLGALDIGQGAIAVGGRVVALEGPEGTDAMVRRVVEMRAEGRISRSRPGVLVKLCKPQQDRRVDLPSIGLSTLQNARTAGLSGIAMEAGRSIVLDMADVRSYADREGLFVIGIEPDVAGALDGGMPG